MRTNLPVTGTERFLAEGEFILSKADMQGNITYINRTFMEISGYNETELMGQPHNMLRHPDMPREAFRDFWHTLKSGKAWSGMVKNRCKNGDHYWVMANASPIWQNGSVIGYMSVRTRPDRKLVDEADTLYRQLRNNETKATLSEGRIMYPGFRGVLQRLGDTSLKSRLALLFATTVVLWGAVGLFGWNGMHKAEAHLQTMVEKNMQASALIADMQTVYAENVIDTVNKANAGLITASAAQDALSSALARADESWTKLKELELSPEIEKISKDTEVQLAVVSAQISRVNGYLASQSGSVAGQLGAFDGPLYRHIDPLSAKLDQINALKDQQAQANFQDSVAVINSSKYAMLGIIALGALMIAYIMGRLYRVILQPLNRTRQQMNEVANGNLSLLINKDRDDEIGQMVDAFKSMFIKLRFEMADSRRVADEAQRIGFALASVDACVSVSNDQNNLIYLNNNARAMMESIFKTPAAVDQLLGKPITDSLDDPELKSATAGRLDRMKVANGMLAGRHMRLVTRPVHNQNGEYLGRVCQWIDRTVEIQSEQQVSRMVEAAAAGDFSIRIDEQGKEGFFLHLTRDLNNLAEAINNSLTDMSRVLTALASGDLTQTMDRHYEGIFAQMKDDANATVDKLKEIVASISEATDAINGAAKEIAAGNADLSRRTESQAASLEETASSTEELTNTVRNNADNATTASQLARTSSEVADRGGRVVSEVVTTMGAIQASSSQIAEIINVIDGIAFQTNILALNAAVEAARAGEQGRGFAVVAGEVRNLAQRSASAAKEIKELISESVNKVSNGYKLVETAGQTMQEIVDSTQRVADIMNDISAASEEQRNGIVQLNHAITSMDETTQQNAALVEQAAAAAQSLEDQSSNLLQAVSVFKIVNGPGKGKARSFDRAPMRVVPSSPAPRPMAAKPKAANAPKSVASDLDEWEEF